MPDVAPERCSTIPIHQDFRWLTPSAQDVPHADFIETTFDLAKGLHTCLQLVQVSTLERAANLVADSGAEVAPAISAADADNLMQLSLSVSALLREEARRRIDSANAVTRAA